MARAMVSEPQTFATVIAARSDLSRSRRDLALALAKAVTGAEAEARRMLADLEDAPDVRASEREFLRRCIEHRTKVASSAAAAEESPFVRAAALVAEAREADAARAAGRSKEAAQGYSSALLGYVDAGWKSDPAVLRRWSEALEEAQRLHRWNKDGEWPAITVKVEPGDTLIGIRKRVVEANSGLLLYTGQIERANQIKGAVIRPGQTLRIPTETTTCSATTRSCASRSSRTRTRRLC
jgi:nucleoid-associated protein YgaU